MFLYTIVQYGIFNTSGNILTTIIYSICRDSTLLKPGMTIENNKAKNCGKFRNSVDSNGLALLRLQEAIGKDKLVAKNEAGEKTVDVEASVPWWWPTDSDEIIKQILTTLNK